MRQPSREMPAHLSAASSPEVVRSSQRTPEEEVVLAERRTRIAELRTAYDQLLAECAALSINPADRFSTLITAIDEQFGRLTTEEQAIQFFEPQAAVMENDLAGLEQLIRYSPEKRQRQSQVTDLQTKLSQVKKIIQSDADEFKFSAAGIARAEQELASATSLPAADFARTLADVADDIATFEITAGLIEAAPTVAINDDSAEVDAPAAVDDNDIPEIEDVIDSESTAGTFSEQKDGAEGSLKIEGSTLVIEGYSVPLQIGSIEPGIAQMASDRIKINYPSGFAFSVSYHDGHYALIPDDASISSVVEQTAAQFSAAVDSFLADHVADIERSAEPKLSRRDKGSSKTIGKSRATPRGPLFRSGEIDTPIVLRPRTMSGEITTQIQPEAKVPAATDARVEVSATIEADKKLMATVDTALARHDALVATIRQLEANRRDHFIEKENEAVAKSLSRLHKLRSRLNSYNLTNPQLSSVQIDDLKHDLNFFNEGISGIETKLMLEAVAPADLRPQALVVKDRQNSALGAPGVTREFKKSAEVKKDVFFYYNSRANMLTFDNYAIGLSLDNKTRPNVTTEGATLQVAYGDKRFFQITFDGDNKLAYFTADGGEAYGPLNSGQLYGEIYNYISGLNGAGYGNNEIIDAGELDAAKDLDMLLSNEPATPVETDFNPDEHYETFEVSEGGSLDKPNALAQKVQINKSPSSTVKPTPTPLESAAPEPTPEPVADTALTASPPARGKKSIFTRLRESKLAKAIAFTLGLSLLPSAPDSSQPEREERPVAGNIQKREPKEAQPAPARPEIKVKLETKAAPPAENLLKKWGATLTTADNKIQTTIDVAAAKEPHIKFNEHAMIGLIANLGKFTAEKITTTRGRAELLYIEDQLKKDYPYLFKFHSKTSFTITDYGAFAGAVENLARKAPTAKLDMVEKIWAPRISADNIIKSLD